MGSWGAGVLDGDAAWDFVDEVLRRPVDDRQAMVAAALDHAGALDVDDAYAALTGALLVAIARSPANLPGERARLLDQTGRTAEVHGIAGLLGSLKGWRAPALQQAALTAVERVRTDSEAAELWRDNAGFTASLDQLAAALDSPLRPWSAAQARGPKQTGPQPLQRSWEVGALIAIDLEDGYRGYAQMMPLPYLACYDRRDRISERPPSSQEIAGTPIAFITNVNQFVDRPPGWHTVGMVSGPDDVPAIRSMFRQDMTSQECFLVANVHSNDPWLNPAPMSQLDCVGLENGAIAGWYPDSIEQRLRDLFAGVPNQQVESHKVRLSKSLARVLSVEELAEAARTYGLAVLPDSDLRVIAYPVEDVPAHAAAYGPGRTDLVLIEMDEAHVHPSRRPVGQYQPEAMGGYAEPRARWSAPTMLVAQYTLVPDGDGYRITPDWAPAYP